MEQHARFFLQRQNTIKTLSGDSGSVGHFNPARIVFGRTRPRQSGQNLRNLRVLSTVETSANSDVPKPTATAASKDIPVKDKVVSNLDRDLDEISDSPLLNDEVSIEECWENISEASFGATDDHGVSNSLTNVEFTVSFQHCKHRYLKHYKSVGFYKPKIYVYAKNRTIVNCVNTLERDKLSECEVYHVEDIASSDDSMTEVIQTDESKEEKMDTPKKSDPVPASNTVPENKPAQTVAVVNSDVKQSNQSPKKSQAFFQGKVIIQEALDSSKDSLIGLEYIVEVWENMRSVLLNYRCFLCNMVLYKGVVLKHLISPKHRVTYLVKYFPSLSPKFTAVKVLSNDLKAELEAVCKRIMANREKLLPFVTTQTFTKLPCNDLINAIQNTKHHVETAEDVKTAEQDITAVETTKPASKTDDNVSIPSAKNECPDDIAEEAKHTESVGDNATDETASNKINRQRQRNRNRNQRRKANKKTDQEEAVSPAAVLSRPGMSFLGKAVQDASVLQSLSALKENVSNTNPPTDQVKEKSSVPEALDSSAEGLAEDFPVEMSVEESVDSPSGSFTEDAPCEMTVQESVDSPTDPLPDFFQGKVSIQDSFDSSEDPLIGLEFIVEVWETMRCKLSNYSCFLCNVVLEEEFVLKHLVTPEHIIAYLDKYFPTLSRRFEDEVLTEDVKAELQTVCFGIVVGQPTLLPFVTTCAYLEKNRQDLIEAIHNTSHYMEEIEVIVLDEDLPSDDESGNPLSNVSSVTTIPQSNECPLEDDVEAEPPSVETEQLDATGPEKSVCPKKKNRNRNRRRRLLKAVPNTTVSILSGPGMTFLGKGAQDTISIVPPAPAAESKHSESKNLSNKIAVDIAAKKQTNNKVFVSAATNSIKRETDVQESDRKDLVDDDGCKVIKIIKRNKDATTQELKKSNQLAREKRASRQVSKSLIQLAKKDKSASMPESKNTVQTAGENRQTSRQESKNSVQTAGENRRASRPESKNHTAVVGRSGIARSRLPDNPNDRKIGRNVVRQERTMKHSDRKSSDIAVRDRDRDVQSSSRLSQLRDKSLVQHSRRPLNTVDHLPPPPRDLVRVLHNRSENFAKDTRRHTRSPSPRRSVSHHYMGLSRNPNGKLWRSSRSRSPLYRETHNRSFPRREDERRSKVVIDSVLQTRRLNDYRIGRRSRSVSRHRHRSSERRNSSRSPRRKSSRSPRRNSSRSPRRHSSRSPRRHSSRSPRRNSSRSPRRNSSRSPRRNSSRSPRRNSSRSPRRQRRRSRSNSLRAGTSRSRRSSSLQRRDANRSRVKSPAPRRSRSRSLSRPDSKSSVDFWQLINNLEDRKRLSSTSSERSGRLSRSRSRENKRDGMSQRRPVLVDLVDRGDVNAINPHKFDLPMQQNANHVRDSTAFMPAFGNHHSVHPPTASMFGVPPPNMHPRPFGSPAYLGENPILHHTAHNINPIQYNVGARFPLQGAVLSQTPPAMNQIPTVMNQIPTIVNQIHPHSSTAIHSQTHLQNVRTDIAKSHLSPIQKEKMFHDMRDRVNHLFGMPADESSNHSNTFSAGYNTLEVNRNTVIPGIGDYMTSDENVPSSSQESVNNTDALLNQTFQKIKNQLSMASFSSDDELKAAILEMLPKELARASSSRTSAQPVRSEPCTIKPPADAKVQFKESSRVLNSGSLFPIVSQTSHSDNTNISTETGQSGQKILAQRLASVLVKLGMIDVSGSLLSEMLRLIGGFDVTMPLERISEGQIILILKAYGYLKDT